MENEYMEIDLFHLLKALWHRAWAIVLGIALFGGTAFVYANFFIQPRYSARAQMYVNNSSFSVGSASISITNAELTAAQSLVDTYVIILKTRTTLEEVIKKADLNYTYEELYDMISAEAVNSTEIFEVVVTDKDPVEAEKIANTIAKVLPKTISRVVDGSSVRIVEYAVVPSIKAFPNITMYTSVGMFLGFIISSFIIIFLEMFDDSIHTEDYLIKTYGLPILAVIPELLNSKEMTNSYYAGSKKAAKKEQ